VSFGSCGSTAFAIWGESPLMVMALRTRDGNRGEGDQRERPLGIHVGPGEPPGSTSRGGSSRRVRNAARTGSAPSHDGPSRGAAGDDTGCSRKYFVSPSSPPRVVEQEARESLHGDRWHQLVAVHVVVARHLHIRVQHEVPKIELDSWHDEGALKACVRAIRVPTSILRPAGTDQLKHGGQPGDLADRDAVVIDPRRDVGFGSGPLARAHEERCIGDALDEPAPRVIARDVPAMERAEQSGGAPRTDFRISIDVRIGPAPGRKLGTERETGGQVRREARVDPPEPNVAQGAMGERLGEATLIALPEGAVRIRHFELGPQPRLNMYWIPALKKLVRSRLSSLFAVGASELPLQLWSWFTLSYSR